MLGTSCQSDTVWSSPGVHGLHDSMNVSQHVSCPTHSVSHALNLVFSTSQAESDLRVWNISACPLSWADHFLLRFNLSVETPLCRENGPVKIVRPCRLLVWFPETPAGLVDQRSPTLGLQMFLDCNSQKPSPPPLLARISGS